MLCHGTPQDLVRDPVAISAYLGNSFTPAGFMGNGTPAVTREPEVVIHQAVQQDRMMQLLESLRGGDPHAGLKLVDSGSAAIPALLDALDRRDVEMRRLAYEVLQLIVPGVQFDPFAPESERRERISAIRAGLESRAG